MNKLFLFDFDGTLSWLRSGWPELMTSLLSSHLPLLQDETPEARNKTLDGISFGLSGQATMVQMQHFVKLAELREQTVPSADILYRDYAFQLNKVVNDRISSIQNHEKNPTDFIIPGSLEFLTWLKSNGETCAIVSGTEEKHVRKEAKLLGLTSFFGDRIYGCKGDPFKYNKASIFSRLMEETNVSGNDMVAFGDGPVEIIECKRLGGYAVAICTNEHQLKTTNCNPKKRAQLLAAGADVAIPDFLEAMNLFD
ncbi:MAG: HAD family hydrolase [Candidatus Latescibacterota bacterium]|nr:HAD family hydrolase [Candidatus Latescibacterota bacterium]